MGYFIQTWRNCRGETLRYRLKTSWLSMRCKTVAGPEPWWSM